MNYWTSNGQKVTYFYVAFLKNVLYMNDVNDVVVYQHIPLICNDNLDPILDPDSEFLPWEYDLPDDMEFSAYPNQESIISHLELKLNRAKEDKRIFFGEEGIFPSQFYVGHQKVLELQTLFRNLIQKEIDFYAKKGYEYIR